MSMVHCRGCGQQIHESAPTCPHCGAPQMTGSAAAGAQAQSVLPEGIKGWSWGAFLLNWVWAIFNGTWIGLLALVPYLGFIMAIVLGFKGREWAWRNKRWDSVEHFQRVQRAWSKWALIVLLVGFLVGVLGAISIPAYQSYVARAKAAQAQQDDEAARSAEAASAAAQAAVEQPAAAAAPPAAASEAGPAVQADANVRPDVLTQATNCSTASDCVSAMLVAASPRRADALQMAANRLAGLRTAEAGDRKAARDLNTQGLARYTANDFTAASELFARAAQVDPGDVEIRSNLGLALVRAQRGREAVSALVEALEIDPRRSGAWVPLAEALDQLQDAPAATAALLLSYEFSANKPKTMDFFRARQAADGVGTSLREAYAQALRVVEAGY